jgi:hypothetical protein
MVSAPQDAQILVADSLMSVTTALDVDHVVDLMIASSASAVQVRGHHKEEAVFTVSFRMRFFTMARILVRTSRRDR